MCAWKGRTMDNERLGMVFQAIQAAIFNLDIDEELDVLMSIRSCVQKTIECIEEELDADD